MKTGLTRHESELYYALCREGDLTGYEAAKISGIPRSNTYQALAGLVDKGGAYIIEGSVPNYSAVPVEEYCTNVKNNISDVLENIIKECPASKNPSEPYFTVNGFKHIVNKMKNIIDNAKERIYISISQKELQYLEKDLIQAYKRGLKVVLISEDCGSALDALDGILFHRVNIQRGQIRLIADSSYVLTGEFLGSNDDTCLFSKNKPLVELIKDSLKNQIRLSQIQTAE